MTKWHYYVGPDTIGFWSTRPPYMVQGAYIAWMMADEEPKCPPLQGQIPYAEAALGKVDA